jgi:hypothetical protein
METQEDILLQAKVGTELMNFYIDFRTTEGFDDMEAVIKEATKKIINIVRNSPRPIHPHKNNDDLRQLLGMKDW